VSCSANGSAIRRTGPTYLQFVFELQNAARVGRRNPRLDHPARNRMRPISPHHQPRYPNGAVDAAPLVAGEIEDDEQIAGKEWRLDRAHSARVPDGLVPFRLKRREPLVPELTFCALRQTARCARQTTARNPKGCPADLAPPYREPLA
jgi:hypothetical protein